MILSLSLDCEGWGGGGGCGCMGNVFDLPSAAVVLLISWRILLMIHPSARILFPYMTTIMDLFCRHTHRVGRHAFAHFS